jgi:hypothetical protein
MTTMINPSRGPLPEGLPSAEQALFESTVPPALVRRVISQDVFVTDLRVLGHNSFQVGVRLPAEHVFYGPNTTTNTHDPLLFLEGMRQAILLIATIAYGIPTEYKYITHEKQYRVSPESLRSVGGRPVDIVAIATARDIRRRGKGFAGMVIEFDCYRDGVRMGTVAYRWSCVTPGGYKRLRGEHGTATPMARNGHGLVAPRLVGRSDEIDVMLAASPSGRGWEMRIAPDHPVVYDHYIDHVPGNGAIEAARQAALMALGRPNAQPVGCEFSFLHYIEIDQPCQVYAEVDEVREDGITAVRIVFEQGGQTAAHGVLEMRG